MTFLHELHVTGRLYFSDIYVFGYFSLFFLQSYCKDEEGKVRTITIVDTKFVMFSNILNICTILFELFIIWQLPYDKLKQFDVLDVSAYFFDLGQKPNVSGGGSSYNTLAIST
ncbi:hypothetical protein ACJX0J_013606 [Zea mays]